MQRCYYAGDRAIKLDDDMFALPFGFMGREMAIVVCCAIPNTLQADSQISPLDTQALLS